MRFALVPSFLWLLATLRWNFAEAFTSNIPGTAPSILKQHSNGLSATNNVHLTNEEISRYSRHLVLTDVGMNGQVALKDSSVLVIGAGGLGSPCLMYHRYCRFRCCG
jgi:hypothetical protein